MTKEQQLDVFCSRQSLETFHAITHQNHIWRSDPYDVESIHEDARTQYERLLNRLDSGTFDDSGRILLLLGESGAGKTHLMRVFRNQTHRKSQGFFSYMQMTSAVPDYASYVLRNAVDSFEKPYYTEYGSTTGLMKLSDALAESPGVLGESQLALLRERDLTSDELVELIYPAADSMVSLEAFQEVDLDVIRALLYLQTGHPALRAKVLKFLRCEPLTSYDSVQLGGMASRRDDALRMMQSLAILIRAVTQGALVICLDQLEEINSFDSAEERFRRAMQTIVTLAEIPNVVVVISCLDDLYDLLKPNLPQSHIDRLELDPAPVMLKARRTAAEVRTIIAKRLQHLYELAGIESSEVNLYPFPEKTVELIALQTTRQVLEWCRQKREESIATSEEPVIGGSRSDSDAGATPDLVEIQQLWNDHVSGSFAPPEDDRSILNLLSDSIVQCSQELGGSCQFVTGRENAYLTTDVQIGERVKESLLLGLCQKSSAGGALLRQIKMFEKAVDARTPVLLRTTDFPSNPNTKTAKEIGNFISQGGRRALVVDSDLRTMMALQSFQSQHSSRDDYQQWLQTEQPLSQLPSFQKILDLDKLKAEAVNARSSNAQNTVKKSEEQSNLDTASSQQNVSALPAPSDSVPAFTLNSTLPAPDAPVLLGRKRSASPDPIEIDPQKLVRHGAFLGGSGSGKTTLALTLIEQLLLRGIPAVLLDRKGDLCSYAHSNAWRKPDSDSQVTAARKLLQDKIEVAVYTPGTVENNGRPLSIAITPPGLGQLPRGERLQLANYSAGALGGIMAYKQSALDRTRMAVLGQAIAVLSELQTDNPLNINRLIEFIAEEDPLLINAIGYLDPKHCKKLAEDLQTLSLTKGHLFDSRVEQLIVDRLLSNQALGKTPLSVINLGSLGGNDSILFWVSQFLLELNRYAQKHPSGSLQAVILFDEADLYLPAQGKPSTKEPMESLLKRARSAGLGILLATQSPGDLDYKCRDQISSWFVGKVKENTALNKLKPMLSEAKVDVTSKLANQKVGEFFDIRAGEVNTLKANMSLVRAEQVPLDQILELAAHSK